MPHARRTTFALLMFYTNKHTVSTFILTKHLFLQVFLNIFFFYLFFFFLFLNMYTHKFKVFANGVYPVQITTSEVTNRYFFFSQKIKKKIKEHAKINSFTVHLLLFPLIILVTFHTIFPSILLCSVSIFS